MKPLDRLLYSQGGRCFFCDEILPKAEASVEHLFAVANGGGNAEENCVVCCKSLNTILGNKSVKEKFRLVLNQKGKFQCPAGIALSQADPPSAIIPAVISSSGVQKERLSLVVDNLEKRGEAKPRTLKTLTNAVAALLPKETSSQEISALIQGLHATNQIVIDGQKVIYRF